MSGVDSAELRATAYRLLDLADRIDGEKTTQRYSHARANHPPSRLRVEAARLYAMRRKRDALMGTDFFSEPGWDMLLALYIDTVDERSATVTSLCGASGSSPTTALRYLTAMCERGWLVRSDCPSDRRVKYIALSDTTFVAMSRILSSQLDTRRKTFPTDLSAYLIDNGKGDADEPVKAGSR